MRQASLILLLSLLFFPYQNNGQTELLLLEKTRRNFSFNDGINPYSTYSQKYKYNELGDTNITEHTG